MAIAYDVGVKSGGNLTLYAVERAATYKEDVFRVDGNHFLLGMLAASIGGNKHGRTLQKL